MGEVVKGGNAFVPSVPLRIAVRNGLDASAWLLTQDGRVRGDADVVFHGAPAHPSGAVWLAGGEDGTVWLEVGLTAIEEEIVRVLVAGSTDGGAIRDVTGPSVEAFAPDGTSVARYDVTDGGGETAMVLAELYRRAGGWKFRAVGQGYLDGLTGLAGDHGVDVAADDGPRPEPMPAAPHPAAAPAAPHPAAAPTPTVAVPQPVPAPPVAQPVIPGPILPADWSFGAVFEPYEQYGRDNDVITVDGLPPGPVIVELTLEGGGYTGLWTLDKRNKQKDNLVNSTEHAFRGRLLTVVPERAPLRLRLQADGPWQLRVLPLVAGRRLTEEWLEWGGPDVLLHTAGTADLAIRYRGDDNLIVHLYELAGHEDPTTLPSYENAVNEIGKRRETVPLPEGPVIVHLEMADGPWQARLKGLLPHSGPATPPMQVPVASVTAAAPIPAPGKVSEPRKVRDWLRRGRR
ncbi:TerD family protein [Streptomyces milbemycinicus]|uniref:TerD family protein n=2 Tax=Streptomyces milbemycinicus TaxID=476552 RepID=UPI0021F85F04|nr:TerD family protein [Streptomyces milbemycinicus]